MTITTHKSTKTIKKQPHHTSQNPDFGTLSKKEVGEFIINHIKTHFHSRHRFYKKFSRGLSHKDIKQDLFLYLWEKYPEYDAKKSQFNTWFHWGLLHVMNKHNVKLLQAAKYKKEYLQSDPPNSYLEEMESDTPLSGISTEDFNILSLRFQKHHSFKTISKQLNLPIDRVVTTCIYHKEKAKAELK